MVTRGNRVKTEMDGITTGRVKASCLKHQGLSGLRRLREGRGDPLTIMVTTKEIARAHGTNLYVEKMGDMVLQQRELAFKKHILGLPQDSIEQIKCRGFHLRKREKMERLGTPERMIRCYLL